MQWDLDMALRRMAAQIEENDALLARLAPADRDGLSWSREWDDEDERSEPPSCSAVTGYMLC